MLTVDGRVVGPCEVAGTRSARRRGLLGRDEIEGALLIERCRNVHTLGMRFAIDVAYVAESRSHTPRRFEVVRCTTMATWRLGRTVRRATAVLEAEAGAFQTWRLREGSTVEVDVGVSGEAGVQVR